MSKVIAFINRKGGTGKTTSSVNVSTQLTRMGFSVALLETDKNFTVRDLRMLEVESGNPDRKLGVRLIQTEQVDALKALRVLRRSIEFDFIVVDGAANMTKEVSAGIAALSDLVIIPTATSRSEIMVTRLTLADIHDSAKRIVLLPNRIHFLTLPENVRKALSELDAEVLDIFVPYYKELMMFSTINPASLYRKVAGRILKMLAKETVAV